MRFEEWEPAYEAILADFCFPREADERARDELAALAVPFDRSRLAGVEGVTVAVAGGAPSLHDEVELADDAEVVFAASTAADVLQGAGVPVDLMVTDLDKNPRTAVELTRRGVPVAVGAHGDNRLAIGEWVPGMDREHVLATTQAAPIGPVENFGGFTDGDRAAFIADAFGAGELVFPGWAFDDPDVGGAKRRKLQWAERLLGWLERRRGDRFAVLDGRRDSLDLSFVR